MSNLFSKDPVLGTRVLLAVLLSAALMAGDRYSPVGDHLRSWLTNGLAPVYWLGHTPSRVGGWLSTISTSREDLIEENAALQSRMLVLERRSQRYASLAAENNRLRELLSSSAALDDSVMVADIIGVTPDPFTHEVILDKGSRDGVRPGQAILDAGGLMGQVVHSSAFSSRVVLISDNSHAVPVEVNRSGARAVLLGTGDRNVLELAHVPDTMDIQEGDLLVSSGLGGRFPQGYPVATISSIEYNPGAPFARVRAQPMASLDSSRMVLVVFTPESRRLASPEDQRETSADASMEDN
ncbi:MAG: rod shape-determining protein MreC [Halomonadaceae bacterium]|nr:MAG: rod shape-determining protein MreC [Halomonadaceae bacterium]